MAEEDRKFGKDVWQEGIQVKDDLYGHPYRVSKKSTPCQSEQKRLRARQPESP